MSAVRQAAVGVVKRVGAGLRARPVASGVACGIVVGVVVVPWMLLMWPVFVFLGLCVGGGAGYMVATKGLAWRDVQLLGAGLNIQVRAGLSEARNLTADVMWEETVAARGRGALAFAHVNSGEYVTFGQADDTANKVAHWAVAQGLAAGDTVALFALNSPRFVAMWIGLAKVGVRTALINSNQKGESLLHSIAVCGAKALVYDGVLVEAVAGVADELASLHSPVAMVCLDAAVDGLVGEEMPWATLSRDSVPEAARGYANGVKTRDPLMYIYTSGTTGLPKAAIITHFRYILGAVAFTTFAKAGPGDRIYTPLPLYHSAATIIGCGMVVYGGAMMVVRTKFSASSFTKDVVKYDVTIVQYIGELCRYLLAAPVHPDDARNSVRLAMGNGLRPDVWLPFKERFGVDQIMEFYAATEGAAAIINTQDKDFSIGYISQPLQPLLPQRIVKFDRMTEQVIRGPDGFCVDADVDEPGEFIAKIVKSKAGSTTYSGYTNEQESNKKVLTNVFADGDAWFRSGDLLRRDAQGFVYFVDRIGDTFRWKGENVATSEVADLCSSYEPGLEFNVYGVTVGELSGRAGMVGLVGANPESFDFAAFAAHVKDKLPAYAVPLFIRFLPSMDLTGTFKHQKVRLRDEGFDPSVVSDPLYFLRGDTYVQIDDQLYSDIVSGVVRV